MDTENNNSIENNDNEEIFTIVEDEVQKMTFIQRLASIFIAPVKLMQNIKHYPVIAAMLGFVMALSLLILPFMGKMTEISTNKLSEIMLTRYGQDFVNFMESAQASTAGSTTMSTVTTISAALTMLATYPLMCFIKALVLLIIAKIAKGGGKYKQYASLYAHVLVVSVLGSLLITPIMVALGTLLDVSSLAVVLMPKGDFSMMSYNILSGITIFTIAEALLVLIGVREINGFSNKRATVVASVMFALSILFTAVMAGSSMLILDLSYRAVMG